MDNMGGGVNKKECYLCGRSEDYTCLIRHHIYRRRNSDDTVFLCSEPHQDGSPSCHDWVHDHPVEAGEYGLYEDLPPIEYEEDTYFIKSKLSNNK